MQVGSIKILIIVAVVVLGATGIAVAATGSQATVDDVDGQAPGAGGAADVSTAPDTVTGTGNGAAASVYGDDVSEDTEDDASEADDESADDVDDVSVDDVSVDQESADAQQGGSPSVSPSSPPAGPAVDDSGSTRSGADSVSSSESAGSADDRS